MRVAMSVAPARSFEAPVDGSPSTTYLSSTTAQSDSQRIREVALRIEMTFRFWKLLGHAKGRAAGQYRHLGHGISVIRENGDECVTSLVDRDGVFLLWQERVRGITSSDQQSVPSGVEVGHAEYLAVLDAPR